MIVANLVHRPVRSLISIVAIAVEVTLILVIVGLSLGMLNDSAQRTKGIGADVIVQPPGSSFLSGVSGAPVSVKVADVLRKLPHVAVVSPVIWQFSVAGSAEVISGIDLKTYNELGSPFRYIEGGPFSNPEAEEALVDDYIASQNNLHVGETISILNHNVKVVGIVEHGKGARKYVPMKTLQNWIGADGKASVFYVKADTPQNADLIVKEIKEVPGMQNYTTRSIEQYLSMMTGGNLPGFNVFITVVIGVSVVIGFIVIFQAMYTAVMERTREIGILKSLGASKLYIVNVILRETALLAVLGVVLGIIISYVTKSGLHARFPLLPITMYPQWIIYATIIAIGGAILGALYPAYKAARKDPIDALAYE